jgi:integrase
VVAEHGDEFLVGRRAMIAIGTEAPKVRRPKISTWTAEALDLFLFLQEVDRLNPLWRILAATGMRRGEAFGFRLEDLDLHGGRVSIRRSRTQAGYKAVESDAKTGRARVVALDADTVAAVRPQIQQQPGDSASWGSDWLTTGHVFTRENGAPWQPKR